MGLGASRAPAAAPEDYELQERPKDDIELDVYAVKSPSPDDEERRVRGSSGSAAGSGTGDEEPSSSSGGARQLVARRLGFWASFSGTYLSGGDKGDAALPVSSGAHSPGSSEDGGGSGPEAGAGSVPEADPSSLSSPAREAEQKIQAARRADTARHDWIKIDRVAAPPGGPAPTSSGTPNGVATRGSRATGTEAGAGVSGSAQQQQRSSLVRKGAPFMDPLGTRQHSGGHAAGGGGPPGDDLPGGSNSKEVPEIGGEADGVPSSEVQSLEEQGTAAKDGSGGSSREGDEGPLPRGGSGEGLLRRHSSRHGEEGTMRGEGKEEAGGAAAGGVAAERGPERKGGEAGAGVEGLEESAPEPPEPPGDPLPPRLAPLPCREPGLVEREFCAAFLAARLGADPALTQALRPLRGEALANPSALAEACRSGVLLCKLLNHCAPDALDERVINVPSSGEPPLPPPPPQGFTHATTAPNANPPDTSYSAAATPPSKGPAAAGDATPQGGASSSRQSSGSIPDATAPSALRPPGTAQPGVAHPGADLSGVDHPPGNPLVGGLPPREALENCTLAINAARAAGCALAGITPQQVVANEGSAIEECLWQIIRLAVLKDASITAVPQLLVLRRPEEDLPALLDLSAEQLLLRWAARHLAAAGPPWDTLLPLGGFGAELADGVAFAAILSQLDPSVDPRALLESDDILERAERVLAAAQTLTPETLASPRALAEGNVHLTLALIAALFRARPGLEAAAAEEATQLALFEEWLEDYLIQDSREERTFRVWILSLLRDGVRLQGLVEGLRDGWVLLHVLDAVAPGSVPWRSVHRPPFRPLLRQQFAIENTNLVVRTARRVLGLPLVNIGGADLVAGQRKLLLAILWQLMRAHLAALLGPLLPQKGGGAALADAELDRQVLTWANARVAAAGSPHRAQSFQDPSLASGLWLVDLLAALSPLGPQGLDRSVVTEGRTPLQRELNAKWAISVARKAGCFIFLLWEDIVEVNPKMLLTFVASVMLHTMQQTEKGQGPSPAPEGEAPQLARSSCEPQRAPFSSGRDRGPPRGDRVVAA